MASKLKRYDELSKVYQANGSGSGTWVYPPGKAHAEIYIDAGATAQTLSGSSAYAKLNPGTEWTAGVTNVLTVSAANGTITLAEAGNYMINFWLIIQLPVQLS